MSSPLVAISFVVMVFVKRFFVEENTGEATIASGGWHFLYIVLVVVPVYLLLANRNFHLAKLLVLAHCGAGLYAAGAGACHAMLWLVGITMSLVAVSSLISIWRGRLGPIDPAEVTQKGLGTVARIGADLLHTYASRAAMHLSRGPLRASGRKLHGSCPAVASIPFWLAVTRRCVIDLARKPTSSTLRIISTLRSLGALQSSHPRDRH